MGKRLVSHQNREGNNETPQANRKPSLTHDELTDVIDLCLWAGQLLLQCGANSFRVEESVHRFGTGLGCDWLDVVTRTESIAVTASSGGEFRTKTRRVVRLGVNMSKMTAINTLSRKVEKKLSTRQQARLQLQQIDDAKESYNRWFVIFMVGLACAAFSQLFGGDWPVFGITFVAASVAMFVRQELGKQHFNPFIIVTICALIAGLIASLAGLPGITPVPETAMTASVLLLVPGVPLINSLHDFLRGYMSNGVTRGALGLIISFCIALGLIIAISITGVGF